MGNGTKGGAALGRVERLLVLLCFGVCLTGALLLPVEQCPDEQGRLLVTDWIVKTGMLPTGDEPELMIPGWGYSYALYPYLSSMIGAVFVKVAALFTGSARVLRAASRMCSVLSVTGCCFICLKLGRRLFERRSSAVLFASLVCFLPQVLFLGMYHNNDALSLLAVAMMLFFFVDGYEKKWPVKSCVGLAAAFSVGLLSYYPIYGWILMCAVFCAVSIATDRSIPDRGALIRKRAALIAALCLLFAGWFFLRSALLHAGDLIGFRTELSSRERMREQGALVQDYVCYRSAGLSIPAFLRVEEYGFIRLTAASFIGLFGNMAFPLPMALYGLYTAIFVLGLLLFAAVCVRSRPCRRDRPLIYIYIFDDRLCPHQHRPAFLAFIRPGLSAAGALYHHGDPAAGVYGELWAGQARAALDRGGRQGARVSGSGGRAHACLAAAVRLGVPRDDAENARIEQKNMRRGSRDA